MAAMRRGSRLRVLPSRRRKKPSSRAIPMASKAARVETARLLPAKRTNSGVHDSAK